jgi:hypothetical protein
MAAKIVKMGEGTWAWRAAGIPGAGTDLEELAKWEAYDFFKNKWVPAKDFIMWGRREVGDFNNVLQEVADSFEETATVYAFDENEMFGVLRKHT